MVLPARSISASKLYQYHIKEKPQVTPRLFLLYTTHLLERDKAKAGSLVSCNVYIGYCLGSQQGQYRVYLHSIGTGGYCLKTELAAGAGHGAEGVGTIADAHRCKAHSSTNATGYVTGKAGYGNST